MEEDQPKKFAQDSRPGSVEIWELDMVRLKAGLLAGGPVVLWGLRTHKNRNNKTVPLKDCQVLTRSKVSHIANSPLSASFYSEAHGVEEWLVRAVRRYSPRAG